MISIQCTSLAGLSKELKPTMEVLNLDNGMLSKQQILLKQIKNVELNPLVDDQVSGE